ncbi:RNA-binding protein 48 [Tachysurus fulvidraco]|uniref:RNA-binding protein 48 n=1 Tax=Tachysurus fulvidraco TaxID=1234273 RepID=UPI000F4D4D4D|nr:RNA-binding protein 48 [Tachysurus fulvidraco]
MASSCGSSVWDAPRVYKHHEQQKVCDTRPKYREGRRLKAVKVYTINLESRFLLVQGVPAIGVMTELVQLFALYGAIEEYRVLDEYPAEQFTEVYLIKFQKLTSARAAKRNTDEKSFYGGILHVCYAPEYESVEDVRKKLQDRRWYINRACNKSETECKKKHTGSKKPADSSAPAPANAQGDGDSAQTETSNPNTYSGFPLLPLPSQEEAPQQCLSSWGFKSHSLQTSESTEDKMGSLHHFIPANAELSKQTSNFPNSASAKKDERDRTQKSKNPPSIVPRFIPRTTHLENRKRKMEDSMDLLGMSDKNTPMFGPKLPEQEIMDMKDASLNTTANLIRQTMTKVSTVPTETKTTSTTSKPRRRI